MRHCRRQHSVLAAVERMDLVSYPPPGGANYEASFIRFLSHFMNRGYIKLWRKIDDNPIAVKPAYLSVFMWLSRKANVEPKRFMWNGKERIVKRGQLITSLVKISDGTGVPRATVSRILKYLKNETMIETADEAKFSLITVKNYDKYHLNETTSETLVRRSRDAGETIVGPTKEDKKVKNEKNSISNEILSPSVLSAKEKRETLLPNEPETMNESIDESFPRKRRYGNEGYNWMLDYYEYKFNRRPQKNDAYNKRYLVHLKRAIGMSKLRELVDWLGDPDCWWYDKISGFDQIWYKRDTLLSRMEAEGERKTVLNLDEIK